jgi:hypothetical protein
MAEGAAQSDWPSCVPHFLSSLEPSLPSPPFSLSAHLERTSGHDQCLAGLPHFQPITTSPRGFLG